MIKLFYLDNGKWAITINGIQRAPVTLEDIMFMLADEEYWSVD